MLTLRPFTPEDMHIFKEWLNKAYIKDFFGEPEDWISEVMEHLASLDWIYYFIVEYDGNPIGFTQYYETDKAPEGDWSQEPAGTVGIDYLIGEESYLAKGFGNTIVAAVVKTIKNQNKYSHIIADPNAYNLASIKVLEKNGFKLISNGLYKLTL